ncbi:hypothetical protein MNBD_PLANCTO02-1772 [hydrothermal vent metagenome]|uniref:NodB homology domain-containing protein n=1 Tax=hydrothermal vent metagenome TaxID=652676 RepID=A0A3B1DQ63_9ZZZZ
MSLCIDESLKLNTTQFAEFTKTLKLRWQIEIQNTIQFLKWIKKFNRLQENEIDEVMSLLGIDCRKFLEEQTPYMTTKEIKQLADDGFVVGAHSLGHDRFSLLSKTEVEREIVESCSIIAKMIEVESVPFAFPFSANELSRQHLKEIYQRNPQVSFLFDRNGFQPEPEFIVQRIIADAPTQEKQSNISQLLFQAYKTEARKKIVSPFQFKKAKKESTCKKEQPLSQPFQTSK